MPLQKTGADNERPVSSVKSHDIRTRRIISAARRVFLKSGFDGASMDEVALEAGVSKRTVCNRYLSKEDLFDEVAGEACRQLLTFSHVASDDLPVQDFLTGFAEQLLQTRLSEDAVSLLRNIAFRSHRMESLSAGYEKYAVQPVISYIAGYLARKSASANGSLTDHTDAAWTFFGLVREPLESQILLAGQSGDDLENRIQTQARDSVNKFCRLYPVFS